MKRGAGAWGWQAGAVAGVDYRLGASAAAGVQLEVTRLSLQRNEGLTVLPGGSDGGGATAWA